MSKNPAAVALGKLAAKKRTKEQLAAAGRLGGLAKAAAAAELAAIVQREWDDQGLTTAQRKANLRALEKAANKIQARNGTGSTPSALADPGTAPVKHGPTKKRK